MKLINIVLRKRRGGCGTMMKEVTLIKIDCKHIHKCHNEFLLYHYCMQINFKKGKKNKRFGA
jgi:hypothetical protein